MVTLREILNEEQSAIRVAALAENLAPPSPAARPGLQTRECACSLKSKAVSVATAISYGFATAGLISSFLEEDIPTLDGSRSLPDISKVGMGEVGADVGFTSLLKTGSALALIKAMGYLMEEDSMAAADAVDEYLALRRRAEKASLGSAIISPPGERVAIDAGLHDLSVELYRMIFLYSIEDPFEQWDATMRFIRKDWQAGLIAKMDGPEWRYR